ncbi:MAG TPA: AarF/UbiB family protein [Kofleriaceae bacterium]|nr:AarF/UbiB family protein [Kofleriaceae bacterium]
MAVLARTHREKRVARTQPKLAPAAGDGELDTSTATVTSFKVPSPSLLRVAVRFWLWMLALVRLVAAVWFDKLARRDTIQRRAIHLRNAIVSMGPLAVQVAQQISMRLDVLPLAYASELAQLKEQSPPMDVWEAFTRIKAALGDDSTTTFEAFDPEPIFSDSISSVYQGVLQTGESVTVKVLRPGVVKALSAERLAIDLVLKIITVFTEVRDAYIHNLRDELPSLMFETVNFIRAARVQEIFRRQTRKHRLKYLRAARVRFYNADVIISDHVSGVGLDEVLAAVENNDPEALARLEQMKIKPRRTGLRLLHVCWWGLFEATLFSNLEETGHITVEPGGRLNFSMLGHTTNLDRHHRRLLATVFDRMAKHDIKNAVEMLLQLFNPLPRIDIHEFAKTMESRIWTRIFRMENKDSPSWERTSTALWLDVLDTAREFNVPVSMSVARMMQSSCLFDQLAARLHPDFRVFKEYRHYRKEAVRRQARLVLRKADKQSGDTGMLIEGARKLFAQLTLYGEALFEDLPIEFAPAAKKSAYFVMQVMVLFMTLAKLTAVLFVGRLVYTWYETRDWQPRASIEWVLSFPGYTALAFFFVLITLKRLLFRISDTNDDDD